jgi:hypothetical protein
MKYQVEQISRQGREVLIFYMQDEIDNKDNRDLGSTPSIGAITVETKEDAIKWKKAVEYLNGL